MRPGAILIDLDGTIYQGNSLIPGAIEALLFLDNAQIPYHFITNTTRMTKGGIVDMLENIGLHLSPDIIFTAPHSSAIYCQNKGYKKILVMVKEQKMFEDFSNFQLVENNPEAIVLGDMGAEFTFNLINRLFKQILDGAELVAMHKNRFWLSAEGYMLDVGAFVAALEYATGRSAAIIGKPNANIFVLASQEWNIPSNDIIMVGDDIEGDVGGALNAGMKSVLVKTGKFRDKSLQSSNLNPNYIINSIADLPSIINLG